MIHFKIPFCYEFRIIETLITNVNAPRLPMNSSGVPFTVLGLFGLFTGNVLDYTIATLLLMIHV